MDTAPVVFTIGHSNHDIEDFIGLLKKHGINLVVDIRSQPYSSYFPRFNRKSLEERLDRERIEYRFLGDYLGGRPEEKEYYRPNGKVNYEKLRQSPRFREGIEMVKNLAKEYRLVLLCSEEDPARCHRKFLVGEVLVQEGVRVLHIRGTGELEEETGGRESGKGLRAEQLRLF